MNERREFAVVIRALTEIDRSRNESIDEVDQRVLSLQQNVVEERAAWKAMLSGLELQSTQGSASLIPSFSYWDVPEVETQDWRSLVEESQRILLAKGIDPNHVTLPPTEHDLLAKDVAVIPNIM